MAVILNIETATDIGSVCISSDEEVLIYKEGTDTFTHAKETTLLVNACLEGINLQIQQIDAVAVSKGPGSYTSLRIGTSVAKGICYALDKPLIAIDTLHSMALAASKISTGQLYAPMIDARRMEVYTALYDEHINCIQNPTALILSEATFYEELQQSKRIILAGNGSKKLKQIHDNPNIIYTDVQCNARYLVPLAHKAYRAANFESTAYFEPTYLKPPNITTPKKVL